MLVSVYLPTKNREALLRRAVESVLTQSYTTLELVVVDDGSTDGTRGYLDTVRTADSRIWVIRNETSLGAPLSRNLAIRDAPVEFMHRPANPAILSEAPLCSTDCGGNSSSCLIKGRTSCESR
jgi:glycosyltransferase involved in cell wall biosynthesis